MHDAGRGLRQRGEHDLDAGVLAQQPVDLGGVQALAPARLVADLPAPQASPSSIQRSPNLPAAQASTWSPGRTRLATADSIAPEPLAANASTSLAPEDGRQLAQHAGVELDERRRAVVEHRLRHRLRDPRRHGVGPAVIRYCLTKGLGVMAGADAVGRTAPVSGAGTASSCAAARGALQVAMELLEVEAGRSDASRRSRRHSEHDADDAMISPAWAGPSRAVGLARSHPRAACAPTTQAAMEGGRLRKSGRRAPKNSHQPADAEDQRRDGAAVGVPALPARRRPRPRGWAACRGRFGRRRAAAAAPAPAAAKRGGDSPPGPRGQPDPSRRLVLPALRTRSRSSPSSSAAPCPRARPGGRPAPRACA